MSLAPIVLFVYNRPEHTLRTLEALSKNELADESLLYIFADGVKDNADELSIQMIEETRAVIKRQQWCKKTLITESETNKGLANSILGGVSKIISEHGKAIVLEDDLITSLFFLNYMNTALDQYSNVNEVVCISGYVYPLKTNFDQAFFIKGADCWGWATWKNKWENFNTNAVELRDKIIKNRLINDFTFNQSYPYLKMLTDRIEGKNQSWAILWYASSFIKDQLCLYPPYSLVHNIGNDGSGTHNVDSMTDFDITFDKDSLIVFPEKIVESIDGRKAFERFFKSIKSNRKRSILSRVVSRIKKIFS